MVYMAIGDLNATFRSHSILSSTILRSLHSSCTSFLAIPQSPRNAYMNIGKLYFMHKSILFFLSYFNKASMHEHLVFLLKTYNLVFGEFISDERNVFLSTFQSCLGMDLGECQNGFVMNAPKEIFTYQQELRRGRGEWGRRGEGRGKEDWKLVRSKKMSAS